MTAVENSPPAALDELKQHGGPIFDALARSGAAVLVTDPRLPDNPLVFVNEAFTRLTGYSSDEVLGLNCRFLQAHQHGSPFDRQSARCRCERRGNLDRPAERQEGRQTVLEPTAYRADP